ncbi:DUF2259 domain-containing protein [Oricola cellulosilytica]|uniref:DUF2259 domain-containing protein n=1 Tax=Oricola cellulosilytica TaxID=1429082 RepID=A0A4R0PBC2_9HYPH|nr:DUF2259 domain-containing protein [Oricola cellulosilytica]TCD14550.1 DUF2259 domain-containing protein [Oricola cellulosilytica]
MGARQSLIALFGSMVLTAPSVAGDIAALNVLGFSDDGATFAFEEYGVQDGSGFPYANRFYIDTASDSFMPGSPIRVRLDDENATLEDARVQAKLSGEAIVPDGSLVPGSQAGWNPITELSADPARMVVNPRPVFPPVDAPLEIRLEEVFFPVLENCQDISERDVGFRLLSVDASAGGRTTILHEDHSVPASRGCPIGYRFGGVQTYISHRGPSVIAVLIAIESFGFEGPDFRWMAVTKNFADRP